MTKEKAKKYIQGRRFEIMCELELPQKKKWKDRLEKEFSFLRYVSNLIDFAEEFASLTDECDVVPDPTIFEHKGYVLQQSGYNNHYMIFKGGEMVMHCQCTKKLDQKGAEEAIDFYIDLVDGDLAKKTERIIGKQNND